MRPCWPELRWNKHGAAISQGKAPRFCYSKRNAQAEDMPAAGGLVYYSRQAAQLRSDPCCSGQQSAAARSWSCQRLGGARPGALMTRRAAGCLAEQRECRCGHYGAENCAGEHLAAGVVTELNP